jgi:hypothetical protein
VHADATMLLSELGLSEPKLGATSPLELSFAARAAE